MAHTANVGSVKRTVNVVGKRLGVKRFGGQHVKAGEIIIRQRGSEFYAGRNTDMGKDFTIYAKSEGFVSFRKMSGYKRGKKYVDIVTTIQQVVTEVPKAPKAEEIEVVAEKKPAVKKTAAKSTTAKKPRAKKAE
jgi:large subunit ribosomal protein L27